MSLANDRRSGYRTSRARPEGCVGRCVALNHIDPERDGTFHHCMADLTCSITRASASTSFFSKMGRSTRRAWKGRGVRARQCREQIVPWTRVRAGHRSRLEGSALTPLCVRGQTFAVGASRPVRKFRSNSRDPLFAVAQFRAGSAALGIPARRLSTWRTLGLGCRRSPARASLPSGFNPSRTANWTAGTTRTRRWERRRPGSRFAGVGGRRACGHGVLGDGVGR